MIDMKLSNRWNKLWIGAVIGVVLPVTVFALIYLIGYGSMYPFVEFLRQTIMLDALTKLMSLCVVPNLGVFYFFLNREQWYATRGIILATLLCTFAIVIINFRI